MRRAGKLIELAGTVLALACLIIGSLTWSDRAGDHAWPVGPLALALILLGRELKTRRGG